MRATDGVGVIRMEDRYDTTPDDLWSALTDPRRLARWVADVEGDLRSVARSGPPSRADGKGPAGWTCASRPNGWS